MAARFSKSEKLGRNVIGMRHEWLLLKKQAGGLNQQDKEELRSFELRLAEAGGSSLTTYQRQRV